MSWIIFSKPSTASALAFPTQAAIDENNRNSLHQYQINFAQVLSKVKDLIPLLFMKARKQVLSIISDLHAIVTKRIEPVRPGRKFPRNFNNKTGRFSYGYKPLR
jgi:hypothetical protein